MTQPESRSLSTGKTSTGRLSGFKLARFKLAGVGLSALALAGCGLLGDDRPPPPCPQPEAVAEATTMTAFAGGGRDLTDVEYDARILDAVLECSYGWDDSEIPTELRITLFAERGPALSGNAAMVPYFIAVVDRDQNVLARRSFQAAIPFPEGRRRMGSVEEITTTVPLRAGQTGNDYKVFLGLELTPEQMEYNRRQSAR